MLVYFSILRHRQDRQRQNQGDVEVPPHACMLPGGEPPLTYSYLRVYIFYYIRHCCGPSQRRGHPRAVPVRQQPALTYSHVLLFHLSPVPTGTPDRSRVTHSLGRCWGLQQVGGLLVPFLQCEGLLGAAVSSTVLPSARRGFA